MLTNSIPVGELVVAWLAKLMHGGILEVLEISRGYFKCRGRGSNTSLLQCMSILEIPVAGLAVRAINRQTFSNLLKFDLVSGSVSEMLLL
jgi:hypothetical protein